MDEVPHHSGVLTFQSASSLFQSPECAPPRFGARCVADQDVMTAVTSTSLKLKNG